MGKEKAREKEQEESEKEEMMSFEEAIKKADEELDKLIYNSECNDSAGLRKAYSKKADWFSVVVYLAKKGLQAEKGGEEE